MKGGGQDNADTLICVEAEALVKKEADTLAGVEVYACPNTLNKVEPEAVFYTQAYTFPQVQAKSVTDTREI